MRKLLARLMMLPVLTFVFAAGLSVGAPHIASASTVGGSHPLEIWCC